MELSKTVALLFETSKNPLSFILITVVFPEASLKVIMPVASGVAKGAWSAHIPRYPSWAGATRDWTFPSYTVFSGVVMLR